MKRPYLDLLRIHALAICTLFAMEASATRYFVTNTGSDANNGLTEATAWATITYAAGSSSPVGAGDTVFVKAGDYGFEQVEFDKVGTAAAPVVFEGYANVPGDAPALGYVPQQSDVLEDQLDPLLMPFLGPATRGQGLGFDFTNASRYVEVRNFQLKYYQYGIITYNADHITLENITVAAVGDTLDDYSGIGIALGYNSGWPGHYNQAIDCLVMNAAAEAFTVFGNGNVLNGCTAVCNQGQDNANTATDYYFIVVGDSNTVSNCNMERMGELAHYGHGFTVKEHGEQNLFTGCTAVNTSDGFCVRHRNVRWNTFVDCEAYGSTVISIRDGASHNTYQGIRSYGAWSGISLFDTSEDGGAQYAGRHNVVQNCLFVDPTVAISNSTPFGPYTTGSPIDGNTVANCTFVNATTFFRNWNDDVHDNALINCIISGVGTWQSGPQDDNYAFEHCRFDDIPITMPAGTGNSAGDPLFTDPLNGDFSIVAGSPCIDAGMDLPYVVEDIEHTPRPQGAGHDIGAYERQISVSLPTIALDDQLRCVPNPATGGEVILMGVEGPAQVIIRDASGAESHRFNAPPGRIRMELRDRLAAGIWWIEVVAREGTRSQVRLVVVR
jgi:hypothetical protein